MRTSMAHVVRAAGMLVLVSSACTGSLDGAGGPGGAGSMDGGAGSSSPDGSSRGDAASGEGTDGASSVDGSVDAGTVDPVASPGCGNADPASGPRTIDVDGKQGQFIVSIPANYDPSRPIPLGFAFHGRNRTGPNCQAGDCRGFQSAMEDHAVLVYMTSLGGTGWEGSGERELNVAFFTAVLARIKSEYCIDQNRIFVAGTSSGAHFTNVLGCRFGDELLAIVPVAGWTPERDGCVGHVAALVIHGVDDNLTTGEATRDFWRSQNGCADTSTPPIAEAHAFVTSTDESHACVAYHGCDPGFPVEFCEHSEGGYDGSTHGWPAFGGEKIWEFVQRVAP